MEIIFFLEMREGWNNKLHKNKTNDFHVWMNESVNQRLRKYSHTN